MSSDFPWSQTATKRMGMMSKRRSSQSCFFACGNCCAIRSASSVSLEKLLSQRPLESRAFPVFSSALNAAAPTALVGAHDSLRPQDEHDQRSQRQDISHALLDGFASPMLQTIIQRPSFGMCPCGKFVALRPFPTTVFPCRSQLGVLAEGGTVAVVVVIKGRSAIHIAQVDFGRRWSVVGRYFWVRGRQGIMNLLSTQCVCVW